MLFPLNYYLKILKNTLLVNFLKFFTKNCYPNTILPLLKFTHEISIDSICNSQHRLIISRRVKVDINQSLFNEIGVLRDELIDPKDIPMMSLNLMGGKFQAKHLKFRTLDKGNHKWDGKSRLFISDFLDCYEILDTNKFSFIYFDGNKIHNTKFPYSQPSNPDLKKQVEHFFNHIPKPENKSSFFEFNGEIILKHDPTNLNYWHLELNIIDFSNKPIKNYKGSAWQKRLFSHIISNVLIINTLPITEPYSQIPDKYFKK